MWEVKFQYADAMSNGEWRDQQCQLSAKTEAEAVKKCKEWYGLGVDCDYRIIGVRKIS